MAPRLGWQGPGQQLAQAQVMAIHHGKAPAQRVVAGKPVLSPRISSHEVVPRGWAGARQLEEGELHPGTALLIFDLRGCHLDLLATMDPTPGARQLPGLLLHEDLRNRGKTRIIDPERPPKLSKPPST